MAKLLSGAKLNISKQIKAKKKKTYIYTYTQNVCL